MPPEQRSAGAGARNTATAGTEREISPSAPRIDPEKVAEKVYQLMRRDLMLERERRGGEENA
jgi:hypothetical protein